MCWLLLLLLRLLRLLLCLLLLCLLLCLLRRRLLCLLRLRLLRLWLLIRHPGLLLLSCRLHSAVAISCSGGCSQVATSLRSKHRAGWTLHFPQLFARCCKQKGHGRGSSCTAQSVQCLLAAPQVAHAAVL